MKKKKDILYSKKSTTLSNPLMNGLLIALLFFSFLGNAQDIHFSQMLSSPLNLNPAETGNFKADHRFVVNYRNQWASVTVPYKTFSASYENRQTKWLKNIGTVGLGALFNSDVAGDGNMGTIQAKFSTSLHLLPFLDERLFISMGLNIAYNQYSIDYSKLRFDHQYNGMQFDPMMLQNETLANDHFNFMDLSMGLKFSYRLNELIPLNVGLGFNHLKNNKQNFSNTKSDALKGKFNTYISSRIPISNNWVGIPTIFYYRQGKYNELYWGTIFEKQLENINLRSISFGLFNRTIDAVVFRLGLNYQSFDLGFSYDLNFSKLKVASRTIGAFEFSLIYLLHNCKHYELRPNRQCPVFL